MNSLNNKEGCEIVLKILFAAFEHPCNQDPVTHSVSFSLIMRVGWPILAKEVLTNKEKNW